MKIKDFLMGERFTNEDFALFSEAELSQMEVLSEEEARNIWYEYCDNEKLPLSYFVTKGGFDKLKRISTDCGWGDEKAERNTTALLESVLSEYLGGQINVCYYSEHALRASARLFCEKWSDFCYPSDYLIIDLGENALLYYEDLVFYLDKINRVI